MCSACKKVHVGPDHRYHECLLEQILLQEAADEEDEVEAGAMEAAAAASDGANDDDDAARAYVDVQVILTRTEAAEVRALQRRAAKASPPRDTAFMHSSTPYVAPRPVSYRPEAKGLPRWNV